MEAYWKKSKLKKKKVIVSFTPYFIRLLKDGKEPSEKTILFLDVKKLKKEHSKELVIKNYAGKSFDIEFMDGIFFFSLLNLKLNMVFFSFQFLFLFVESDRDHVYEVLFENSSLDLSQNQSFAPIRENISARAFIS